MYSVLEFGSRGGNHDHPRISSCLFQGSTRRTMPVEQGCSSLVFHLHTVRFLVTESTEFCDVCDFCEFRPSPISQGAMYPARANGPRGTASNSTLEHGRGWLRALPKSTSKDVHGSLHSFPPPGPYPPTSSEWKFNLTLLASFHPPKSPLCGRVLVPVPTPPKRNAAHRLKPALE